VAKTSICLGGTKDCALYFDHVVPVLLFVDLVLEHNFDDIISLEIENAIAALSDTRNQFVKLFPPELVEGSDGFEKFVEFSIGCMKVLGFGDDSQLYDTDVSLREVIAQKQVLLNAEIRRFLSANRIANAHYSSTVLSVSTAEGDAVDVAMTLSGLNLIDTDRLAIDQIVEFRNDRASMAELRRLRLFFEDEYVGKSRSYIEDDLLQRIENYDAVRKKWGFELRHSALSTLFESKTAAATIGGAGAALLAGAPVIAASAATIGTILEIGKIGLSISKKRFEARDALGNNPVSYLAHAKEHFGS